MSNKFHREQFPRNRKGFDSHRKKVGYAIFVVRNLRVVEIDNQRQNSPTGLVVVVVHGIVYGALH